MDTNVWEGLQVQTGAWRLDGIGTVIGDVRRETRIKLYASQIHSSHVGAPYTKEALTGKLHTFEVHPAKLAFLRIGTVWKDGVLANAPPIEIDPFQIDVSGEYIVGLDNPISRTGHTFETLIPESHFRLEENRINLKNTRYALLPVINNPRVMWLVIPCSEILRFYYGVSSRLLSATVSGDISEYIAYENSFFDGREVTIHAKTRLTRLEAGVLARSVASSAAKAAMWGVNNHIVTNKVFNNNIPRKQIAIDVEARFPFTDSTTLRVAGKRMPLSPIAQGEPPQWALFVMQIHHCNHSFGYRDSKIVSDEPATAANPAGGQPSSIPKDYPYLDPEREIPVGEMPANKRLRKVAHLIFNDRFAAMEDIRFKHERPFGTGGSLKPITGEEVDIKHLSIGGSNYQEDSKHVLGVSSFDITTAAKIGRDLSLFLETVLRIMKLLEPHGWKMSTRALNSQYELAGHHIANFPTTTGVKRPKWNTVQDGELKRNRRVIIAEFFHKEKRQYFYVLEMELKPEEPGQCTLLLRDNSQDQIPNETFQRLLILSAVRYRWILQRCSWKKKEHAERHREFVAQHSLLLVRHPNAAEKSARQKPTTQPDAGNSPASDPDLDEHSPDVEPIKAYDPEEWSQGLLEKIKMFASLEIEDKS